MHRGGCAASALVFALICVATLRADYVESFRRAVDAYNRKNWDQAINLFREAIGQRSQDTGERLRISGAGYFEPYLPHYFLGAALFAKGDCAGALAEWKTSAAAGAVQNSKFARDLVRDQRVCEARLGPGTAPAPPPPRPSTPPTSAPPASVPPAVNTALVQAIQQADAAIGRAEGAERTVAGLANDSVLAPVWRQDARFGEAEGRAKALLSSARSAVDDARRSQDVKRATDAADAATRAGEQFETIRQTAVARRAELVEVVPVSPRPAPGAPSSVPSSIPPGPTTLTSAPPSTSSVIPPVTRAAPPPELVSAARLFFNAQYSDAAAAFARVRTAPGPEALQASLFRAASVYALYLTGGERDQRLRNEARQSVLECRRRDARFTPDERVFSPRFVQFYKATR